MVIKYITSLSYHTPVSSAIPTIIDSSLTLDFSNASSDVQNVNTLLQKLLDKFFPNLKTFIIDGVKMDDFPGFSFNHTPTEEQGDGFIYLYTCSSANANLWASSATKLDVRSATKLTVKYGYSVSSNYAYISIADTQYTQTTGFIEGKQISSGTKDNQTYSFDVSGLSEVYLNLWINASNGNYFKIYDIYCE